MKRRTAAAATALAPASMSIPLGSSVESGVGSSTSGDVSERQSLVSALEHFHDDGDDEQQQHRSPPCHYRCCWWCWEDNLPPGTIHFLVLTIEGSMQHPEDFDRMASLTFLGCSLVSACSMSRAIPSSAMQPNRLSY